MVGEGSDVCIRTADSWCTADTNNIVKQMMFQF